MSQPTDASRDLLFGLLALQNGLIDQEGLLAAFGAWTLDKGRPLAEHMVGRGDLQPEDRAVLEALAARHVGRHGGVEQSLAAVTVDRSARESVATLGDPELATVVGQAGSADLPTQDGRIDGIAGYATGTAVADGQRFRVLRPHARGGLGAVFVALDSELHREVALKQILDNHADDPISRQRFLLEAEITGGLEHPGIVPVYGLGTYGDGRPYYAMRFIRGDSLKEAIDRSTPSQVRARSDPRPAIARAPQAAPPVPRRLQRHRLRPQPRRAPPRHQAGQHHRRQARRDSGRRLGTGQAAGPGRSGHRRRASGCSCLSSASGSTETLPGSALGTPAYMSPEQAGGDLDRLGPRSDVYSLGATLYCLLTGKPPFEGRTSIDVTPARAAGRIPPPRQLDPSIDRALEAVCLKAMALEPEDRYATPRALADDIEHWLADEPVSGLSRAPDSNGSRAGSVRHRTWTYRGRSRRCWGSALAATIGVVVS